jgi:hypothetical protein
LEQAISRSTLRKHFQRLEDTSTLPFRPIVVERASAIKSALPKERAAVAVARSNDRRWISFSQNEWC